MKNQILQHLKNSGHYDDVGLGLSLAAVRDEPVIRGNHKLWVLQLATDPIESSGDIGEYFQDETVVYGIAISVKAYNDRTGSKVDEDVDSLIRQVRLDLFDFLPAELIESYSALRLAGGNLQKFVDGQVLYIERFKTQRTISQETL